ncbi:MAG: NAD(P)-dependent oxidoreductase [Solirubrobacteraceae bacterium]
MVPDARRGRLAIGRRRSRRNEIVVRVDCLTICSLAVDNPIRRVGFVGVGAMGDPMSSRIAAAGYATVICDAEEGRAARLAAGGPRRAGEVAALAEADAVVLMLPNSDAVESVLLGDGVLESLAPGAALIDMSSSDPQRTVELGARVLARGVGFADAPVSGGVARAGTGELTAIVGAEATLLARIEPLLRSMASNVFHVGGLGSGHAAKALNNLLSATGLMIAAEAVEAGRRSGIDPHTLLELINLSTGMNHATQTKIERYVLRERFDSGFRAGLMLKDLRLAKAICERTEIGTGLAGRVAAEWEIACERLAEDADQTEIARVTAGSAPAGTGSRR